MCATGKSGDAVCAGENDNNRTPTPEIDDAPDQLSSDADVPESESHDNSATPEPPLSPDLGNDPGLKPYVMKPNVRDLIVERGPVRVDKPYNFPVTDCRRFNASNYCRVMESDGLFILGLKTLFTVSVVSYLIKAIALLGTLKV